MQLPDDKLQIIPLGQLIARHTHGIRRAVMPGLAQAVVGELANEFDVGLVLRAHRVLKRALIGIANVGLGMLLCPRSDFIFIYADLAVFEPGIKLGQRLGIVVFAHARVDAIVPAVQAADKIVAVHVAVRHQRTAVCATPVKHADLIVVTNDHQIDIAHQSVRRHAILQSVPARHGNFVHVHTPLVLIAN